MAGRPGRDVLMTDASPAMVAIASRRCGRRVRTAVVAAEDFERARRQNWRASRPSTAPIRSSRASIASRDLTGVRPRHCAALRRARRCCS